MLQEMGCNSKANARCAACHYVYLRFCVNDGLDVAYMSYGISITLPLRSGMSLLGSNLLPVIRCAILGYYLYGKALENRNGSLEEQWS